MRLQHEAAKILHNKLNKQRGWDSSSKRSFSSSHISSEMETSHFQILFLYPKSQLNELIDQDVLTLLGWSPALKLTPYAKHFQFSCSSRFTRHFVMGYPGIPKTNSKSPKPNQKSPKTIPNLFVGLGWLWFSNLVCVGLGWLWVGLLKSLLCYLR